MGSTSEWSLDMRGRLDAWSNGFDLEAKLPPAREALLALGDNTFDILAIGPLTNLAEWAADAELAPILADRVRKVWVMGGCVFTNL